MIIGGYSLHLYCDTPQGECSRPISTYRVYHEHGTPLIASMSDAQIDGVSASDCYKVARKRGWKLDLPNGHAWCPWCVKDKKTRPPE